MSSNKVVIGGPAIPSSVDTPLDIRTRVNTVDDIYNIEAPYVGMIVYVINQNKYYKVKTLKDKEMGSIIVKDALVDTIEDIILLDPVFKGALSVNRAPDSGIGQYSSASGYSCIAEAYASHAEGYYTETIGTFSHVEGYRNTISRDGSGAHAEGCETRAIKDGAHSEGYKTLAAGVFAHAEGRGTTANGANQHVQGRYNIEDTEEKYAHIVGNGAEGNLSNAHTLDWDGNAWFAGDVSIGIENKKLATEDMVVALQQEIAELRAIIEELKNK